MDENQTTRNSEERPTSGSDFDGPMSSAPGETDICEHCGAPITNTTAVEQLLARLGLSDDMIAKVKSATANIDVDEYVTTAREYLKTSTDKATKFTKENPAKVAAGVAVLALGAGLVINAMRKDDNA